MTPRYDLTISLRRVMLGWSTTWDLDDRALGALTIPQATKLA